MSSRPITLKLVAEAFSAADDCLASLQESRSRVGQLFPLSSERLVAASDEEEVSLDAFVKRFENLVETGQRRLFRAAMITAEEEHEDLSARELRERLGRIKLLASPDDWKAILDVRNRTAHVYPADDVRAAELLNAVYAHAARASELVSGMLASLRQRFPDAPPRKARR